jgi:uncharacterized damage-inducible protein DinB
MAGSTTGDGRMIDASYVRTMAAYNAAMNQRLYEAASRLGDEERRAERGVFWGSIHGTLGHILWADRMQMSRFAGWPKPEVPLRDSGRIVGSFEDLSRARVAMDEAIVQWAATLDPRWFDGELTWYSAAIDRTVTCDKGLLIAHLFNHQTHHRGQVHALITRAGGTVADTDLWIVVPEPM